MDVCAADRKAAREIRRPDRQRENALCASKVTQQFGEFYLAASLPIQHAPYKTLYEVSETLEVVSQVWTLSA